MNEAEKKLKLKEIKDLGKKFSATFNKWINWFFSNHRWQKSWKGKRKTNSNDEDSTGSFDGNFEKYLKKMHEIIKIVRCLPLKSRVFKDIAKKTGVPALKFMIPVSTRWNSLVICGTRFLKLLPVTAMVSTALSNKFYDAIFSAQSTSTQSELNFSLAGSIATKKEQKFRVIN
jgi:hypothetical protein